MEFLKLSVIMHKNYSFILSILTEYSEARLGRNHKLCTKTIPRAVSRLRSLLWKKGRWDSGITSFVFCQPACFFSENRSIIIQVAVFSVLLH